MSFELDEPVGIDPRVDVVFHKLFGDPAHPAVLLDFLSAVLQPEEPFATAEVLNPFDPGHYNEHRGVVLDIRARTADGRVVQIEMQRANHAALLPRMLYGWARLYSGQLTKSEPYSKLQPVVSIWVCDADPFPDATGAHLRFEVRERAESFALHDHFRLDVLRLSRWVTHPKEVQEGPAARWFWFLNEAAQWRTVPDSIKLPVLEEAMSTLYDFRRDVQLQELYRGRLEAERLEAERRDAMDEAQRRIDQAERDRERAERDREQEQQAREQAERDREQEQQAREQAERDREQALLQRAEEAAARLCVEERLRSLEAELARLRASNDPDD